MLVAMYVLADRAGAQGGGQPEQLEQLDDLGVLRGPVDARALAPLPAPMRALQ